MHKGASVAKVEESKAKMNQCIEAVWRNVIAPRGVRAGAYLAHATSVSRLNPLLPVRCPFQKCTKT